MDDFRNDLGWPMIKRGFRSGLACKDQPSVVLSSLQELF
jgi:hypothetical protein